MKKCLFSLALILGLGLLFSCARLGKSTSQAPSLTAFQSWLGTWERTDKAGAFESWEQESETKLGGMGFGIEEGDTAVYEILGLEAREEGIFYIADVPHNSAPVPFKLMFSKQGWIFENPNHDFPQRIHYRLPHPDSLEVEISLIKSAPGESRVFRFVKRK